MLQLAWWIKTQYKVTKGGKKLRNIETKIKLADFIILHILLKLLGTEKWYQKYTLKCKKYEPQTAKVKKLAET